MLGQAFQTLGLTFEVLRENQKLDPVCKILGRVSLLEHGPCCSSQPRYVELLVFIYLFKVK